MGLLKEYKWPLTILTVLATAVWLLAGVFGPSLGVPQDIVTAVMGAGAVVGGLFVRYILPLATRDSDGDGTVDLLDDDATGN